MEELFEKLDLSEYLSAYNEFLARPKPLFISGHSRANYEKIEEISSLNLKSPKEIANLDDALMRVSKQTVLHISEIYEFSKIIEYFNYLKSQNFGDKMRGYLDKIEIPSSIDKICEYFDENGEIFQEVKESLAQDLQELKTNLEDVSHKIKQDDENKVQYDEYFKKIEDIKSKNKKWVKI